MKGRRVIQAGQIRIGGGGRSGGIDPTFDGTTRATTSSFGLVGIFDETQGKLIRKAGVINNSYPVTSTPSKTDLPEQPIDRYQTAPLTTSKPNYQPTTSEIKRARKAPLLRRKQYGEELRHKHRRKYLLQERTNIHREGANAASDFVQRNANEAEGDEYDYDGNATFDENENNNIRITNENEEITNLLSEEDKEQQNELIRLNMQRRSAQALQKLRLDRSKKQAEESLHKAKRKRMEEMAKLIRRANRKEAESKLSKSTKTASSSKHNNARSIVQAVSNDVIVRVSTSWSGMDVGTLAREISGSVSNDNNNNNSIKEEEYGGWTTTGLTTTHRPVSIVSPPTLDEEIETLPPRKPRVPRLSGGVTNGKIKKKNKKKKKKRKNKKKKKEIQPERKPERKPAVPRLSGRALSKKDTNIPTTDTNPDIENKTTTSISVNKKEDNNTTTTTMNTSKSTPSPSKSKSVKEGASYAELQARREGAKIYIAQQREKRYQLKIRERMTKNLEEKKRIESLKELDGKQKKSFFFSFLNSSS